MDRWAEQFFGRPKRDKYRSSPGDDGMGFMETMARSFVSSAAKRAMGEGPSSRGGGFDAEDFRTLSGFVVEMLNGGGEEEDERRRRRHKKRRHREKERRRERARDLQDDINIFVDEKPYVPKYSKRRRLSSGSPLHVKFAEPLEEFHSPPRRKHRHRHRYDEEPEPDSRYESRHGGNSSSNKRRSRQHRHKIDLQSLRTGLEDMSSTIISLNARAANHRDCEFYDKFVRKGGHLQDVIGSTLGQIRVAEEEEGEAHEEEYDRERRKRRRRREHREW